MAKGQQRAGALTIGKSDPLQGATFDSSDPTRRIATTPGVHPEQDMGDLAGFQVTFGGGVITLKLASGSGYLVVRMNGGTAWKMSQRLGVASAQSARDMPSEEAEPDFPQRVEASGAVDPIVARQMREKIQAESSKARSKGKKK